jgi:hypothetical protein
VGYGKRACDNDAGVFSIGRAPAARARNWGVKQAGGNRQENTDSLLDEAPCWQPTLPETLPENTAETAEEKLARGLAMGWP